ncbi:MAG: FtsX-like permease family protein, partial [Dehalococcoidia bacterium]|nr:FtsX-like permease family protein [Dehalococcoidia bacterium]
YTLQREPPTRSDVIVQLTGRSSQATEFEALRRVIEPSVADALGSFVSAPIPFRKSATMLVYRPGQPIPPPGQTAPTQPRGYVQTAPALADRLRITAGQWPSVAVGAEIPAVAGREGASELGLQVGDTVILAPVTGGPPVTLRVVALADAANPDDRFWTLGAVRVVERARDWVVAPLFVAEDLYPTAAGAVTTDYTWLWQADTTRVTTANAAAAERAIASLRATIPSATPGATVVTALDRILADYFSKLALTAAPLYLLILQIVGLALFYLVVIANVLVERQAGEIALLKSRGASTAQVLLIFFIEGALLCAGAALVGPPLALGLTELLGRLPWSPLATMGPLPVALTAEVWALAAMAAGLSLVAMLIPAFRAARASIVLYRRGAARDTTPPVWQRYYLDVGLFIVGAVGLWSIRSQSDRVGADNLDPLLLLSPALLALAVSAALLRLLPLALRLLVAVANALAPTPAVVALLHMSRRPAPATRLVLLLTLTTSLGLFAATFSGTIDRSYRDRAAYRVGADARIVDLNGGLGAPKAVAIAAAQPFGTPMAAFRTTGAVGRAQSDQRYQFLAIDPATATRVVWWRDDFSATPLAEVVSALAADGIAAEEPILPPGESVLLLVRPQPAQPRLNLLIRLRDADDRLVDLDLGPLDFADWRALEAPLSQIGPARAPLRLVSVYLQQTGGFADAPGGSVLLDDLAVREASGIRRIVEPFDSVGAWETLRDGVGDANDQIAVFRGDTRSGTAAIRFAWSGRRVFGTRGIRLRDETGPTPIVASPAFLAASSRRVGDSFFLNVGDRTIPVVIRGVVEYFPTLDPDGAGFVVAPLDGALARMNSVPGRPIYPNEVWISAPAGVDLAALSDVATRTLGARTTLTRQSIAQAASADPLVAAGWSGILALAFLVALLLSLIGFLVQSALALQRRVVEFAILRTMGFSFQQVIGMVAFEQVALISG